MKEEWKQITGFTGYEVSNKGRIRSYKSRWGVREYPKIINGTITKKGYKRVVLYNNGTKCMFVHDIVARAFVPNNSTDFRTEVNHKDGNKLNNNFENLEWVTHQENINHAVSTGLKKAFPTRECRDRMGTPVICTTTGEYYPSLRDAEEDLNIDRRLIGNVCSGISKTTHGLTFQYADVGKLDKILYVHQREAVEKMHNGCILVGGVGSGKSRTALAYFWKVETNRMRRPKNLYIITTARKRDSLDWNLEAIYFDIDPYNGEQSPIKFTVDSWNSINKYVDISGSFFIFDEQRVVGYGSWVKSFLKICKKNNFVLLSATPGDCWMDYIPIFIANGFYKNKTEFITRHVIYSRFSKYPKVDRYIGVEELESNRKKILVNMNYDHSISSHVIKVDCDFDYHSVMRVYRGRWDIFENRPIRNAGGWCFTLRKVVNTDESRIKATIEIFEEKKRIIVFYNFDYELEALRDGLREYLGGVDSRVNIAEYNGHRHDPIPDGERWIYLVQYNAASEAWNCITTDTIVFYSLNYSYKMMEQASGRIRRMNSPYSHLYYYVLYSKSVIDKSILTALRNKKDFNAGRMYRRKFDKEEV